MAEFIRVASSADIKEGSMSVLDVNGREITLARVDTKVYAFDDVCTHEACSLGTSDLEGKVVTCDCHGSQFDITTGAVLQGPAEKPIATFPVRVTGDDIEIEA